MHDFAKYEALGNDYLVVDPRHGGAALGPHPRPAAVRLLCDRRRGIGADGVLLGPARPPGPGAAVPLRIYNADGSECGMSGNGVRMFALYLAEHHVPRWRTGEAFGLRVGGGDAVVRVADFAGGLVRVDLGGPRFAPAPERVRLEAGGPGGAGDEVPAVVTVTDLSLGVPHTVVFRDRPDDAPARRLGPRLAWHPRFPDGTNVSFVRVRERDALEAEFWERAAGYVPASGSCACAAAAAAHARGLTGPRVRVRMPGGEVDVAVGDDGGVSLTGTVREVVRGAFSASLRAELGAELGAAAPQGAG